MASIYSCCNCFGNSLTLNNHCSPTVHSCGDCLKLGHLLVGCENSIAPCDTENTLKIPFDCFCFPCANPQFKITNLSKIKYVEVISIDKTGITVQPDGTGKANSKVEIEFFAMCADDCDVKSDFGSISLYLKDICKGVVCEDGYKCNDCTGDCDQVSFDLSGLRPEVETEENTSGFIL